MEPITVTRANGELLRLQSTQPFCHVTDVQQFRELIGEDTVTMTVESSTVLPLTIGDTVSLFGQVYTLNTLPPAEKKGDNRYVYSIRFEGPQYNLLRVLYFNQDANGFSTGTDFSLTGTLDTFLSVLMHNIGRALTGWTLTPLLDNQKTETKTLTFNGENCLSVLQKLCQEFGTEFSFQKTSTGQNLTIGKQGRVLAHVYEYGRAGGLYTLKRQPVSETGDFVTRLYAFGANKNLKSNYRNFSTRLKLPLVDYIENVRSKLAFGLIEGQKTFEDVFPRRKGTVTAVSGDNAAGTPFRFTDAGMDFDLTEVIPGSCQTVKGKQVCETKYLLPGVSAKVSFLSGNLAGYEFEISAYDHLTKTFSLIAIKDERGMEFPQSSGAFSMQPGDTYTLLDISMPDSYIEAAERELLAKASEYLAQASTPKVQYSLTVDELYLRRNNPDLNDSITNVFELGDSVQLLDTDLGIDKASRVVSFTRDGLYPYRYTVTLADSYEISLIERILQQQQQVSTILRVNKLLDGRRAKMSYLTTEELKNMIFDPDGTLDGGRIKPESIETYMLSVGGKSGQFGLSLLIEPNFEGNPNKVRYSSGALTHYAIEEEIKTWQVTGESLVITDSEARYVYAKCHRTNLSDAKLLFTKLQIKPGDDSNYYHFLVGVLSSVYAELKARDLSLTYGSTTINGRFIRTGRILSADGKTYFDLDSGEIGGIIKFLGDDGQLKDLKEYASDGGNLMDFIRNSYTPFVRTMQEKIDGKIESWFGTEFPSWPEAERKSHTGDNFYNKNTKGLFRYDGDINEWVQINDGDAVAAFQKASEALAAVDGKTTTFLVEPTPPYDPGDLWLDGKDMLTCIVKKLTGQNYNRADWDKKIEYDSTQTAINGGIVTTGTLQLGDKAGITGQGTTDDSVRIYSGASFANRALAPFRVLQSGEMFARKRVEVLNENNIGQAGICGANTVDDGVVRIWAGVPYAGRVTAPFRVLADGSMVATSGRIGNWDISSGGLVNESGTAYIITRSNNTANRTEARIGSNVFPGSFGGRGAGYFVASQVDFGGNWGAIFSASGSQTGENYAIETTDGTAKLGEVLINGQRSKTIAAPASTSILIEPSQYDFLMVTASGTSSGIEIKKTGIRDGKEITLHAETEFRLYNTLRNRAVQVMGYGGVTTIIFAKGEWYVKSAFANSY